MTDVRIAAVMAAYNRRALTLECLGSLEAQRPPGAELDVFVLDDASTDGTGDAIRAKFPDVTVLTGDGQQYWNGGMRHAFGAAIAQDYDCYLWMNDDTTLDAGAVQLLLATERELYAQGIHPAIVAGSTRHPETTALTYGGHRRTSSWRPLHWELVEPGDRPRRVDTMNGNTTLIPREVVRRVGNIDPGYIQQMGDFDYGLRAGEAGCTVWIAPGTIGTCASHPDRQTDDKPFVQELRRKWSVKEQPFRPWAQFNRRWAGPLWPVSFAFPYVRHGVELVVERVAARVPNSR